MAAKRKMIIDIDTGTDDAQALIMALSLRDTIDVIAVTCVAGNTSLDNVYIPVYRGCTSSLLGERGRDAASGYHGSDGLGNVQWVEPAPLPQDFPDSQEHASVAISRLIELNPELMAHFHKQWSGVSLMAAGEVTLVALGPLTNIAVALKLSPHLGKKLGELVVMGGSVHERTPIEFNFFTDPEAANIVFSQVGLGADRFFLIPIETCMESNFDWDWADAWMATDTVVGRFHADINRVNVTYRRSLGRATYSTCDPCAMLVAVACAASKPLSCSAAIKGSVRWNASVDLRGAEESRGQLHGVAGEKDANVTVVTAIDVAIYKHYLENMLRDNIL